MDQVKIGKFIADLRRKNGLTQETLGEKIGVTNKTISRWENGNYMPDIEMLQLLAQEFQVSINELLSGERLSGEDFRQKADENVIAVSKASVFSFEERKAYFKKKWRKEHISLLVVLFFIFVASIVLPFVFDKSFFVGLAPLVAFVEYGYQNNKMMIYVERNLYEK
ncbi:MAG: helix-turn-helix transcriptional regulator [Oscillospiraceae bacterium]|nr:helix-turn-helix transcriptional regulator [Oscillospiraceae bacterium]